MIKLKTILKSIVLSFSMIRCATNLEDFVNLPPERMREMIRNKEQIHFTNSISGDTYSCPSEWLEEIAIANVMPQCNKITVLHKGEKKLYRIIMRPEFAITKISLNHISLMEYIFRIWDSNNVPDDKVVLNSEDFKEEDKQNIIEILIDWCVFGILLCRSDSPQVVKEIYFRSFQNVVKNKQYRTYVDNIFSEEMDTGIFLNDRFALILEFLGYKKSSDVPGEDIKNFVNAHKYQCENYFNGKEKIDCYRFIVSFVEDMSVLQDHPYAEILLRQKNCIVITHNSETWTRNGKAFTRTFRVNFPIK
jgi:hypothetical protein